MTSTTKKAKKAVKHLVRIGDRIARLKDDAWNYGEQIDRLEGPEPGTDPRDFDGDRENAVTALELVREFPGVPPRLARIKVDYRPTPAEWGYLDAAKDMGVEIRAIMQRLEDLGHDGDPFYEALDESMAWFNEFC